MSQPPLKRQKLGENLNTSFLDKLRRLQKLLEHFEISTISSPQEEKDVDVGGTNTTSLPRLLKYGSDVNINFHKNPPPIMPRYEQRENSPPNNTMTRMDLVNLTEFGGDVNIFKIQGEEDDEGDMNGGGYIPLHHHIMGMQQKIWNNPLNCLIRLLISDGGDVNCPSNEDACIHIPEIRARITILQLLLKFGTDVNEDEYRESTNPQFDFRDPTVINSLLSVGSDVNSGGGDGGGYSTCPYLQQSNLLLTELLMTHGDMVNCHLNSCDILNQLPINQMNSSIIV